MSLRTVPSCPKCGAEASEAITGARYTCTFCGATSVVEAPATVTVVKQQVVETEVVRRVVLVDTASSQTSLLCPKCNVALFEGKATETILHGCGTCGGLWLDNLKAENFGVVLHHPWPGYRVEGYQVIFLVSLLGRCGSLLWLLPLRERGRDR